MKLRRAGAEDVPALLALVEGAYRGEGARRGWTHEADLLGGQRTDMDALRATLADADQTIIVAEEGGALCGCVTVSARGDGLAYLGMLTVAPPRQGGGLGRALVEAAERHACNTLRADRMEMTVIRQRGDLIAWYERLGYQQTGELRPFPLDDPRFGLPLRRDLEFVVLEKALA